MFFSLISLQCNVVPPCRSFENPLVIPLKNQETARTLGVLVIDGDRNGLIVKNIHTTLFSPLVSHMKRHKRVSILLPSPILVVFISRIDIVASSSCGRLLNNRCRLNLLLVATWRTDDDSYSRRDGGLPGVPFWSGQHVRTTRGRPVVAADRPVIL